jgi:hypothetical protein
VRHGGLSSRNCDRESGGRSFGGSGGDHISHQCRGNGGKIRKRPIRKQQWWCEELNAVEVERADISRTLDSIKVELTTKTTLAKKTLANLRMHCVGINERLLKQLFTLDQVISAGNEEIRDTRKELVGNIQLMMGNTDQLILTLDKKLWYHNHNHSTVIHIN